MDGFVRLVPGPAITGKSGGVRFGTKVAVCAPVAGEAGANAPINCAPASPPADAAASTRAATLGLNLNPAAAPATAGDGASPPTKEGALETGAKDSSMPIGLNRIGGAEVSATSEQGGIVATAGDALGAPAKLSTAPAATAPSAERRRGFSRRGKGDAADSSLMMDNTSEVWREARNQKDSLAVRRGVSLRLDQFFT